LYSSEISIPKKLSRITIGKGYKKRVRANRTGILPVTSWFG
jgi:hypothetical protein